MNCLVFLLCIDLVPTSRMKRTVGSVIENKEFAKYVYISKRVDNIIQGISRVVMSSTELKMQPTIHLQR
jgi:hypothetical protein